MTQPQSAPVHSIAHDILKAVKDGGPGEEPAVLSRQAIRDLEDLVDTYLEGPELFDVVETVLYASHMLETELQCPTAAKAVLGLVERRRVLKAMKGMNAQQSLRRVNDRAEAIEKGGRAFEAFAQRMQPRLNHGGPVPKGAVQVGLAFPRRM